MNRQTIILLEDDADRMRGFESSVAQLSPSYRLRTWRDAHRRTSQSKNLVHPLRQVAGGFDVGCLVTGLLRNPPTLVTGAVQRSHHSGPVGATVEQFRTVAPGARRGRRGAEVFDVDSHDAFAEHVNPSLG